MFSPMPLGLLESSGRHTIVNTVAKAINPFQPAMLKEFSRKTVENFVTTQKALLDVMYKPARAAAQPANGAHKKPPQRKRAATKHVAVTV